MDKPWGFLVILFAYLISGCTSTSSPSGGNNINRNVIEGPFRATDYGINCEVAEKRAMYRALKNAVPSYFYGQKESGFSFSREDTLSGSSFTQNRQLAEKYLQFANARINNWNVVKRFRNQQEECGITVDVFINFSSKISVNL